MIKLLLVLLPVGFQLTGPMLGVVNFPEVSAIMIYSLALVIFSYAAWEGTLHRSWWQKRNRCPFYVLDLVFLSLPLLIILEFIIVRIPQPPSSSSL